MTQLQDMDSLPRDRYGRPMLIVPGASERTPFTRASTLSGAIENTFGLEQWKQRQIVLGLALRPHLLDRVDNPKDAKGLNAIVADALAASETDRAADLGTHIHAMTVRLDAGGTIPEVVPEVAQALEHYQRAMHGWQILGGEQFVANRQIMCAGTFDRVIKDRRGNLYVADIKTGLDAPKYANGAQVQCAVYAHGTRYTYPGDTWDARSLADKGISQERAIMIHLPQDGSGCRLYWLDITMGWRYAMIAAKVRSWWNMKLANPIPMNGLS